MIFDLFLDLRFNADPRYSRISCLTVNYSTVLPKGPFLASLISLSLSIAGTPNPVYRGSPLHHTNLAHVWTLQRLFGFLLALELALIVITCLRSPLLHALFLSLLSLCSLTAAYKKEWTKANTSKVDILYIIPVAMLGARLYYDAAAPMFWLWICVSEGFRERERASGRKFGEVRARVERCQWLLSF